jgi:rhodanese-related sulfurtransferase
MAIEEIDVDDLADRMDAGASVLDVREPAEWAQSRVPGAVLVPLGELPARLGDVPPGDPVLVICRSGARSMRACEYLAANGREALNVAGGILAWTASGRPVEHSA